MSSAVGRLGRRAILTGLGCGGVSLALGPPGYAQAPDGPEALDNRFNAIMTAFRDRPPGRRPRGASAGVAVLRGIQASRLSDGDRVRLSAVLQPLETEAALEQLFSWGTPGGSPYVVHPRGGAHLRAAAVLSGGDEKAATDLAEALDRETGQLTTQAEHGVVLPALLLERTLALVEAAAAPASGAVRAALERQAKALGGLRSRAPSEPGVWSLPQGEVWYALTLSLAAGARTDPDAAHRRALAAVEALHEQADVLLRAQGLARGSVAERLRILKRDPRHRYPSTEAGKAQAAADMTASLRRVQAQLPRAFARAPGSAEVRRMSPADEAAGRAGRREPGGYVVDLIRVGERPPWTLASVVHHELHPGHLLQEALVERPPHPLQARAGPGFSEGWATYAEQLADELDVFAADPLGRLGYLQWMLFRLGRVVVDTGIHARRWSRARAIAEFRRIQGESIAFISIEDDVDRICMQPGAAAGQGLAALEIVRIREDSRRRLGARFDLPAFHEAVLKRGALSTPGLEAAVALWEAGLDA